MPWEFAELNVYQKAALIAMIDERIKAEKKQPRGRKKKRR